MEEGVEEARALGPCSSTSGVRARRRWPKRCWPAGGMGSQDGGAELPAVVGGVGDWGIDDVRLGLQMRRRGGPFSRPQWPLGHLRAFLYMLGQAGLPVMPE